MRLILILWGTVSMLGSLLAQGAESPPPTTKDPRLEFSEGHPPPTSRQIIIQNLTPFARRQPVACVVPFAEGVAIATPELTVDDLHTVWVPFGARWPDNSWRQALCMFVIDMPRLSEARLPLLAGIAKMREEPIPMPTCELTFVVKRGDKVERAVPIRARFLERNAMRRVEVWRARIGQSGLVAEMTLTAWRKQRHADISVAVFYSDPTSKESECKIDELTIECRGMGLALRHAGYLGVNQAMTPYGSRTVLLRDGVMVNGQGLRRIGVLVPPLDGNTMSDDTLRANLVAPLLAATTWHDSNAFGPFGFVPQPPPWLPATKLRDHFAARHQLFVQGENKGGAPFGNGPFGSWGTQSRDAFQPDYGICKLSPVAWTGLPSMLLEIEPSILQEACRPVHFFDQAVSPQRSFVLPDQSAQNAKAPDDLEPRIKTAQKNANGWRQKRRDQWSSNHLAAYALLTGSHWARLELENETRILLAHESAQRDNAQRTPETPLEYGRITMAMAWQYCVSGDKKLRFAMNERLKLTEIKNWVGRDLPEDHVRPLAVRGPDERWLGGKHPYWNPWEDAIAAMGFAAQHLVTGNDEARQMAEVIATNVVRNGWLLDEQSNHVAIAMRWQQGTPFTDKQWLSQDQNEVVWANATSLSEWSIGAVEIARVVAERDGDIALLEKAQAIQERLRSARQPPESNYPALGGFDSFGEWDAVIWKPN